MRKQDLNLILPFIDEKNPKLELNFAKVIDGAIVATDTKKVIQFNVKGIFGNKLIHKKLFKGLANILGQSERLHFKDGYLHTDIVKFGVDTGYFVEDEDGKHKLGAKASDFPDTKTITNMHLPYHFTLDNINDLHYELAQKNCFVDDIHLNPVIAYSACKMYDIYYKPQTVNEKNHIETATVKIVATKTDSNGVIFTQFIAVFMGRVFESQANKTESVEDTAQEDFGIDDLYEDAKKIVIDDNKTSISYLQRTLGIGYNRTARIVEALENNSVLSEPNAKGIREILI